jgi:hypothetical protein
VAFCTRKSFPGCSVAKLFPSITSRGHVKPLALQIQRRVSGWMGEKLKNMSSKSQVCDKGFEEWMRDEGNISGRGKWTPILMCLHCKRDCATQEAVTCSSHVYALLLWQKSFIKCFQAGMPGTEDSGVG